MRVQQREALEIQEAERHIKTQEAASSPRKLRCVYGKGRRDMLRSAYARRRKVDAVKGLLSTGDELPHGATISDVLKPKRRHDLQRSQATLSSGTSDAQSSTLRLQTPGTGGMGGHMTSADTLEAIAGGGDGTAVRRDRAATAAASAGLSLPRLRGSMPAAATENVLAGDDSDDSWDDAMLGQQHGDNVSDGGLSADTADWIDPATGLPGTPPLPKGTMQDPPRKIGLARRKAAARAALKAVQRRSALNAMTLRREALQGGVQALQAALQASLSKGALTAEAQLAVRALLQGRGQGVLGGDPLKPERVFPNLTIAGLSNMRRTSAAGGAGNLQHGGLSLPSAGIAAQGMPGGPQLQLQPLVFPPLLESALHQRQLQQLHEALQEMGVPHERLEAMKPLIQAALYQPALQAADPAAWAGGGQAGDSVASAAAEHALADAAAGGDVFAMTVAVAGLAAGAPSIARQRVSASKAPFRNRARHAGKGVQGGSSTGAPATRHRTSYIREMQQLREGAEVERQWRDRAVVALPPPIDQHQGGAGGGMTRKGAVLTGATALAASTSDPNLFAGDADVGAQTDSLGTRQRHLLPKGGEGRSSTAGKGATQTALYTSTSASVSARRMSGGVRGGHANPYMHVTRGQAYPGAGGYRAESHAFRARDVTKELFASTWSTGGHTSIARDPTLPRVAYKGGGQIDHARTAEIRLERSARGLPQPKQTHTRLGGYRHGSRKASLKAALKGGIHGNNQPGAGEDASSDDYSSSDDEDGGAYALQELFPVYRRGLNHHSKYEEPAARDRSQRGVGGSQLPRQQQAELDHTRKVQLRQSAAQVGGRGVPKGAITLSGFRREQLAEAAKQAGGHQTNEQDAAVVLGVSPPLAATSPTGTLSLPLPATGALSTGAFALDAPGKPASSKRGNVHQRLYQSKRQSTPGTEETEPILAHAFLSREVHPEQWIGGGDFHAHLSNSNVQLNNGAPRHFHAAPAGQGGGGQLALGGRDLAVGAKHGFLRQDGSRDAVGHLLFQSAVKASQQKRSIREGAQVDA